MKARGRTQVLAVLISLFGVGAALRVAVSAEAVTAQEVPTSEPVSCDASEAPAEILAALQQREIAVAAREETLESQAEELAQARAKIAEQVAELEAAEAELKELVATYDKGTEPELTQLTATYEAMKPEDAARLFTEMDPQFAAGFLARMNPQAAAGVLTGLDPALAYAMSVELAGRNANSLQP